MKWITAGFISLGIFAQMGVFGVQGVIAPVSPVEASKGQIEGKDKAILALIDSLVACESGNRWNIRVLDTNNRYSYGGLQFQMDTFIRYNRLYKVLPDMEDSEALNAIYDEWTQRELAYHILEDGGFYNWKNCYDHQL